MFKSRPSSSFLAANRAALSDMSHWLQLRHAPETGGAVKFNLFTVTVAREVLVYRTPCGGERPVRPEAWLYTGLEF